jgi:type I restriction enzyme S subunit
MVVGQVDTWVESTVADEFHVQLGKRLDAAVNRGELRSCINNRGVRWGHVLISESVLAPLTKPDIRDLRLVAGDVLVCEGGEIGRASVWNDELPEAYFLNTLHRLRSKGRYEPRLLVAFFERWATTGELLALVGKSSLAHLTKENLLRVYIPVPTPAEQKRLVETLLAVEKLIAGLERLVTKKQAIKQGMKQQLLTGNIRLPGFTGPWLKASLGDISAFITKGATPTTYGFKWESSGVLFLRSECVSEHGLDMTQSMFISSAANRALRRSQVTDGDILMTITGYVGRVIRLAGISSANINQHIARVRINDSKFDRGFVYHFLSQRTVRDHYETIVTGQAYPQISLKQVRETEILAPPVDEQRAICEALNDADTELAALRHRLVKARAVKQGMMQQLLTSRTRPRVSETAA